MMVTTTMIMVIDSGDSDSNDGHVSGNDGGRSDDYDGNDCGDGDGCSDDIDVN